MYVYIYYKYTTWLSTSALKWTEILRWLKFTFPFLQRLWCIAYRSPGSRGSPPGSWRMLDWCWRLCFCPSWVCVPSLTSTEPWTSLTCTLCTAGWASVPWWCLHSRWGSEKTFTQMLSCKNWEAASVFALLCRCTVGPRLGWLLVALLSSVDPCHAETCAHLAGERNLNP